MATRMSEKQYLKFRKFILNDYGFHKEFVESKLKMRKFVIKNLKFIKLFYEEEKK